MSKGKSELDDPYGVAPDYFCRVWGEETIPAALDAAEQAPSTTPDEVQPRCPECGSINIWPLTEHRRPSHQRDANYRCSHTGCWAAFDEPLPPISDADGDSG